MINSHISQWLPTCSKYFNYDGQQQNKHNLRDHDHRQYINCSQQIREVFANTSLFKIGDVVDCSLGVDHQVNIVTLSLPHEHNCASQQKHKKHRQQNHNGTGQQLLNRTNNQTFKFIVKHPKQQPDKIMNELVGCTFSHSMGVPVPQIIFYQSQLINLNLPQSNQLNNRLNNADGSKPIKNYIFQSYIQGTSLRSSKQSRSSKTVYTDLGIYLRRIHANRGTGFGKIKDYQKLIGQHKSTEFIKDNMFLQINALQAQQYYPPKFTRQIRQYYNNRSYLLYQPPNIQRYSRGTKRKINQNLMNSSIIHGDYCADNVIVKDGHVAGVIDFGDLVLGSPMEDFARLYVDYHGTQKWEYIVKGYQMGMQICQQSKIGNCSNKNEENLVTINQHIFDC